MTPQELAHWRYRIGALDRELTYLRDLQSAARQMARCLDGYALLLDDAELIGEQIHATQYLLEEARYMVELGTVQLHMTPTQVQETPPTNTE